MIKRLIGTLYRQIKVKLNTLLSRVIVSCDLVLMQVYPLFGLTVERAHRLARAVGNAGLMLRSWPRQDAYRLAGKDWTVVYVGEEGELAEICRLFFPAEQPVPAKIGRIARWSLDRQTAAWLEEGVDLVISETSSTARLERRSTSLQGLAVFYVAGWIEQVLDLPESLDPFYQGGDMRAVRHKLHVAAKAGFEWYYSRDKADFDLFYHHMYVPYVRLRHGERVLVAPYQDQWQRWFSRGGLLVVTQQGRPVGGVLCYVRGRTCYAVEAGVRDGDSDLMQQQIDTFLYYAAIEWGHRQGVRVFNMGGTRPARSDGVFVYKSRWRARVVERSRIHSIWTVTARSLLPALRAHLNELGLVARQEDGFYGVFLDDGSALPTDIDRESLAAKRQGLAGLLVVAVDSPDPRESVEETDLGGVGIAGASHRTAGEDAHLPEPALAEKSAGIEA